MMWAVYIAHPHQQFHLTLSPHRPVGRQRTFSEELFADVAGLRLHMGSLTGACTGTELSLASDSLPFGTVVLGSRTSKRLQLVNSGDLGTKFAWDTRAFGQHFSIFPAGGLLVLTVYAT